MTQVETERISTMILAIALKISAKRSLFVSFFVCAVANSGQAEPLVFDFSSAPGTVMTSVRDFVVTGATAPGASVKINGDPVNVDEVGSYTQIIPLVVGANILDLVIERSGLPPHAISKTVDYQPSRSLANSNLLYVDVVPGDQPSDLDGTMVIDLDQKSLIGILSGTHVAGISANMEELYMQDRTVVSTSTHQPLRVLPFGSNLPLNGFLVSPDGSTLYSRSEVVDVGSNTLLDPLPIDITTGGGFSGASVPGGPAISENGMTIFAGVAIQAVNTVTREVVDTGIYEPIFVSDIAIRSDLGRLFVSRYGGQYSSRVDIYDSTSFELLGSAFQGSDFSGEIGFLDNGRMVLGAAGNPAFGGGAVSIFEIETATSIQRLGFELADNLITAGNKIFAAGGSADLVGTKRFGVNVLSAGEDQALVLDGTYFLGVNRFIVDGGRPKNDQIRRIVLRPSASPGADFNADGNVDQLDLSAWQTGYGLHVNALRRQGDADGDGDVDGRDFLLWQSHFGTHLNDISSQVAVPEPTAGTLLFLQFFLIQRLRSAKRIW
jgi:hypothetical protein